MLLHGSVTNIVLLRVRPPGGYRVLELTAGLVVISIAFTSDLRD